MKYLSLVIAFFLFSIVANAQTVKTPAGHQLTDVEMKIAAIQIQVDRVNATIKELLATKSQQHRDVLSAKELLQQFSAMLPPLLEERKALSSKELSRALPSTDVALLKVIAIQNERIIELLERAARNPKQ